jgi:hypothetical protein
MELTLKTETLIRFPYRILVFFASYIPENSSTFLPYLESVNLQRAVSLKKYVRDRRQIEANTSSLSLVKVPKMKLSGSQSAHKLFESRSYVCIDWDLRHCNGESGRDTGIKLVRSGKHGSWPYSATRRAHVLDSRTQLQESLPPELLEADRSFAVGIWLVTAQQSCQLHVCLARRNRKNCVAFSPQANYTHRATAASGEVGADFRE